MTIHNDRKRVTQREQFNKAVRAKAHKDNVRFSVALEDFEQAAPSLQARSRHAGHTSRPIPNYSLQRSQLLEDTAEPEHEDIYDPRFDDDQSPLPAVEDVEEERTPEMTESLLDYARPAKEKTKGRT